MKIGIIVQARMGSTRLPGKTFKEVLGYPLLSYLIDRLRRVEGVTSIILATTTKAIDNILVTFATGQEIFSFRGSETNVLERFYLAAKARQLDVVVRVTADCPLIDPAIITQAISEFVKGAGEVDYISNTLDRTYPRGMDVEVFSFAALEQAYLSARDPFEQEHVTPYIYLHPEQFKIKQFKNQENLSLYRWTVDTPEDFELIEKLLTAVYPGKPQFTMADLVKQMELHPAWIKINQHIAQKKL